MCRCFSGLTPELTKGYFGNSMGLYGISTAVRRKIQDLIGNRELQGIWTVSTGDMKCENMGYGM